MKDKLQVENNKKKIRIGKKISKKKTVKKWVTKLKKKHEGKNHYTEKYKLKFRIPFLYPPLLHAQPGAQNIPWTSSETYIGGETVEHVEERVGHELVVVDGCDERQDNHSNADACENQGEMKVSLRILLRKM